MTEPQPQLDELRRLLDSMPASPRSDDERRLRRLANALAVEVHDPEACRHCQQMMPDLAEAELRGVNIAERFPDLVAHLDTCQDCALDYAELLDILMELEEAMAGPALPDPPALPARLKLALRLRPWVLRVAGGMAAAAGLADLATFEALVRPVLDRLAELTELPPPRQATQLALGWGGEAAGIAQLVLASWYAVEGLVQRFDSEQLEQLAASGQLARQVEGSAKDLARQFALGDLRSTFQDGLQAEIAQNPAAFAGLARLDD